MKYAIVAAAILASLAAPAVASAQVLPYQPPVVSLVGDDSSITATITNPNDSGICTLSISSSPRPPVNDPNDHTRTVESFTDDDASWPQAGQSVELTRDDLQPGVYDLTAWCGKPAQGGGWVMGQLSNGVSYEVRVGSKPEPTGSLAFGS